MWEGALFALQLCGLWILIHWLMNDERVGGKAETGLLAVRRVRDVVAPNPSAPTQTKHSLRLRHKVH